METTEKQKKFNDEFASYLIEHVDKPEGEFFLPLEDSDGVPVKSIHGMLEVNFLGSDTPTEPVNGHLNFVDFYNPEFAAIMKMALMMTKNEFVTVNKHYEHAAHSPSGQWAVQFFITPKKEAVLQGMEIQSAYDCIMEGYRQDNSNTMQEIIEIAKQFKDVFK